MQPQWVSAHIRTLKGERIEEEEREEERGTPECASASTKAGKLQQTGPQRERRFLPTIANATIEINEPAILYETGS